MQNLCNWHLLDTVCLRLPRQSARLSCGCCSGEAGAYLSDIHLSPACAGTMLRATLNLPLRECGGQRVQLPICTPIACACMENVQFLNEATVLMRERRQELCGLFVCFDVALTLYVVTPSSCKTMPVYPSLPF